MEKLSPFKQIFTGHFLCWKRDLSGPNSPAINIVYFQNFRKCCDIIPYIDLQNQ